MLVSGSVEKIFGEAQSSKDESPLERVKINDRFFCAKSGAFFLCDADAAAAAEWQATDPCPATRGFLVAINEWEYLIIEDDPAKNELATKDLEAIKLCVGDWMAAGSATNPNLEKL